MVTGEATEVRLARIETKLDLVIDVKNQLHDDHENRLRGLERRFWVAIGFAVASLAANAGQLVTFLGTGAGG